MPVTNSGQERALNGDGLLTPPLYLALLTAAPAGSDPAVSSLSEYAATGYARVAVSGWTTSGNPRVATNSSDISTAPISGADGLVELTHWALVTSSSGTGGVVVAHDTLTGADRTPEAGQVVKVATGALTITAN